MHKTTYTNYEQGKRGTALEPIIRLAKLYGVSIDYIAGLTAHLHLAPAKIKSHFMPLTGDNSNAVVLVGVFLCIKNGGALWAASAPGSSMDCWVRAAAWWWSHCFRPWGCAAKSHATALMVIVPLSLVSAVLYLVQGRVTVMDALPWLPGSLLGLPWQPPDAENLHRLA